MRLTYEQLAMHLLLGDDLPRTAPRGSTLAQRIRFGREALVRVAGVDHGYDLRAWHHYLCSAEDGAYRWSNKHLGFAQRIEAARADKAWISAVRSLEAPDET